MTHPSNRFELAPVINSMLSGNIKSSFTLWSRMQVFYLVTFLQRYLPLCPRLTLNPRDSTSLSSPAQLTPEKGMRA
jgi:hypothetical protein